MKRCQSVAFLLSFLVIILYGCGNFSSSDSQNPQERGQFIAFVQQAVNQYQQITGYPPIKNENENTPIYQMYIVDFSKLKNYHLIGILPPDAYERGGSDMYVLIHAETKPQVKLIEMHSFEQMAELQNDVREYMRTHHGEIPKKAAVSADFFLMDTSKFSNNETQIVSPYSQRLIDIVINKSGDIAMDYTADIIQALHNKGIQNPDPSIDLRTILVDQAYYVPAWSYPYFWMNNQITLTNK